MASGSTNFAMLFQIKDGPACIVFSLFTERSVTKLVFEINIKGSNPTGAQLTELIMFL